ncbi:MAG: ATP-binding protein [Candidatus Staskawiczbacteria bacterium]|nr:ATP-binding protein [Candidatus Staskawiczbacteria bacterium]
MKLRSLLIFLFLIVSLGNSIIGGLLYYFSDSTIAINNKSQSLFAIAQSRAENIKTYFSDEIDKLKLISSRTQLKIDVENYLKAPSSELKEIIRVKLIGSKNAVADYRNICFIDINGKAVTCADSSLDEQDFSQEEFFVKGKVTEGVYFFDHVSESHTDIVTSGPIIPDEKLMGVIVTFEGFDELGKIVKNRVGLKETGEVLIAYRNKETGQITYPFTRLFTTTTTTTGEPMKQALFGNESIFQNTLDYRGVPVVAASQYIDIADMGLVAKMDISEVIGEYRTALIKNSIIFGLIGLFISFIISFILAYFISRPLNQLTKGAEIIGKGNLDYKIDVKSKDEIGQVAKSFNEMTSRLKESYSSLEEKISVRTQDLENAQKATQNILEDIRVEKQNLAEAKAKDEALLQSIGEGVIAVDKDGEIIFMNKVAEKLLGWKINEAIGKFYIDVISLEDEKGNFVPLEERPIAKSFARGFTTTTTTAGLYIFSKNKIKFPVAIIVSPVILDNKIIGAIEVFHDITKEKAVDKAKTEFISLASHQLKTPPTAIKLLAERILGGKLGKINKKQKEYLNDISFSNQRMIDIVNTLLDVSHIEMGTFNIELQEKNIGAVVKNILRDLKPLFEKSKLKLEEKCQKNSNMALIDEPLFRMVINNIVVNAINYTPEKGKIKVECRQINKGETLGEKFFDEDSFAVIVSDTGCGIPEAQQDKIFTKFFRADNVRQKQASGTGLGLYLVKSILDNSGGTIWFSSKENEGAIFYVAIPTTGMRSKKN